jgi:signal peptidase I
VTSEAALPVPVEQSEEKPPAKHSSFWRELPILIVIALALAFLLKTFLVQAFYIPSGSMENTLQVGDRVMVNKLAYTFGDIQRGDVVVFSGVDSWDPEIQVVDGNPLTDALRSVAGAFGFASPNEKDYIKRVIGLPGDHVQCCDKQGRITVNGVPLNEDDYLFPGNKPSDDPFDIRVPEGRIWVMGDHRAQSSDSRFHISDPGGGAIPIDSVVGRAFVVIWPLNDVGLLTRPDGIDNDAIDAAQTDEPSKPKPAESGSSQP